MSDQTEHQAGTFPQSRPWTHNEIEFIAAAGGKVPMPALAKRLNRTEAECSAVWTGICEERKKQEDRPVAPVERLFMEMSHSYEIVGMRIMDLAKWLSTSPTKEAVSQVILDGLTKTRATKLEGWQFTDKDLADSLANHLSEFFSIHFPLIVAGEEKPEEKGNQQQTTTST